MRNDEFDEGEPEIISLSDTEYMMDARTSIDDLNELLGLVVEGDGFDTLAALFTSVWGRSQILATQWTTTV